MTNTVAPSGAHDAARPSGTRRPGARGSGTAGVRGAGGGSRERRPGRSLAYATAGILLSLVFVLPLAWALIQSFEPGADIAVVPSAKDFGHLTFANYTGLFGHGNSIGHYVLNSFLVALGTAVATALVALLAGYGFGRFRFRGQGIVFGVILVTLMIPFQAILTPLFLELNQVHLTNSLVGLALFYVTFNLPFGVFIMRNTFLQIPAELEDAAFVDGAGHWVMVTRVLRPLVLPGVATTVLYAFLFSWTEFLGSLTFITSQKSFTLPVELFNLEVGTYGQVNLGYLVAGAVIAMIPCVVLYVSLQRYYVQGLMSGSLKG
jgi:multiple sugar transport system permease protein